MLIHDLRCTYENGGSEISASLDAERVTLRFSVPDPLVAMGDAFVAIALVTAMARGETLRVALDIPVSRRLLGSLRIYQEIYVAWWPHLHIIEIDAPTAVESVDASKRVACFFSGGVDSMYSVVRHLPEIDDLILCRGLDIAPDESERWDRTVDTVKSFAAGIGKRLVCIETDAKKRYRNYTSSNYGALLISTALPLGYARVIVPSSHITYRDLVPWGTHPLTDPLLGTATTDIVHDGATARTAKTEFIVEAGIGLGSLRVCNVYSLYNCGKCEKCLRTMSVLAILGAKSAAFPPYTPLALRSLRLEGWVDDAFWKEILTLARSRNQPRHARAISKLLSRFERREALRSIDQRWLGGAGLGLLRGARDLRSRAKDV
ncbi:MAG: hypothetical protein V4550_18680 [Gemmatimonadota bacterium]